MIKHLHQWRALHYNARAMNVNFSCTCKAQFGFNITVSINGRTTEQPLDFGVLNLHRFFTPARSFDVRKLPTLHDVVNVPEGANAYRTFEEAAFYWFSALYSKIERMNRP